MIRAFWVETNLSVLDDPIIAFLICYFVGWIFQELTSFIHKNIICHSENIYLRNALIPKLQHHLHMEPEEIDTVNKYVADKLGVENSERKENIIYNYCKNYYYKNSNTGSIDRDQAIAAMARSLSFYCFFAVLIPLIKIICLFNNSSASCCNVIFLIVLIEIISIVVGISNGFSNAKTLKFIHFRVSLSSLSRA